MNIKISISIFNSNTGLLVHSSTEEKKTLRVTLGYDTSDIIKYASSFIKYPTLYDILLIIENIEDKTSWSRLVKSSEFETVEGNLRKLLKLVGPLAIAAKNVINASSSNLSNTISILEEKLNIYDNEILNQVK